MKLGKWIDEKVHDYARPIILFIHYKFWLLYQPEVSVSLIYNGRNCGSSDNLNTEHCYIFSNET